MKCLWINGWGIPAGWLETLVARHFPGASHTVVPPDPAPGTLNHREAFDRLGGFSLGAFLLLRAEKRAPSGLPLGLLAPFFGFAAEHGLGGRVRSGQLRFLKRWLRRDPLPALDDFYRRAGLDELSASNRLPCEPDLLLGGIDLLIKGILPPVWPVNAVGFAGANDPLLDSGRLSELCPRLGVIPHAGHHPAPLLQALANEWNL